MNKKYEAVPRVDRSLAAHDVEVARVERERIAALVESDDDGLFNDGLFNGWLVAKFIRESGEKQ